MPVSPSPSYRVGSILQHASKLTITQKKKYHISSTRFSYTYHTCNEFVLDFQTWLIYATSQTPKAAKQIVSNLMVIWKQLDSELCILPNKLAATEDLEDVFFIPLFLKMKKSVSTMKSKENIQASTIMAKLSAIKSMVHFIVSRDIFIGILFKPYKYPYSPFAQIF